LIFLSLRLYFDDQHHYLGFLGGSNLTLENDIILSKILGVTLLMKMAPYYCELDKYLIKFVVSPQKSELELFVNKTMDGLDENEIISQERKGLTAKK